MVPVDRAGARSLGEDVVEVAHVHDHSEGGLLNVRHRTRLLRRGLGLGEDGEQNGGENRDDRDNDEELDKGEAPIFGAADDCRSLVSSIGYGTSVVKGLCGQTRNGAGR